jgi:hypothetical protein
MGATSNTLKGMEWEEEEENEKLISSDHCRQECEAESIFNSELLQLRFAIHHLYYCGMLK